MSCLNYNKTYDSLTCLLRINRFTASCICIIPFIEYSESRTLFLFSLLTQCDTCKAQLFNTWICQTMLKCYRMFLRVWVWVVWKCGWKWNCNFTQTLEWVSSSVAECKHKIANIGLNKFQRFSCANSQQFAPFSTDTKSLADNPTKNMKVKYPKKKKMKPRMEHKLKDMQMRALHEAHSSVRDRKLVCTWIANEMEWNFIIHLILDFPALFPIWDCFCLLRDDVFLIIHYSDEQAHIP